MRSGRVFSAEAGQTTQWGWAVASTLCFLPVLLPVNIDSALFSPVMATGLNTGVSGRLYELLKALMLWAPLGMMASLILSARNLHAAALWTLALLALGGVVFLDTPLWRDFLELLAAPPGLALGAWLGLSCRTTPMADRSVRTGTPRVAPDGLDAHLTDSVSLANSSTSVDKQTVLSEPPVAYRTSGIERNEDDASPALSAHAKAGELSNKHSRRQINLDRTATSTMSTWLYRGLALTVMALAVLGLMKFPMAQWQMALAAIGYLLVLVWKPQAWLLLLPIALPLLDLAPWSGRLLYDEFDLFMLLTLSMGLWQQSLSRPHRPSLTFLTVAGFFVLAYVISLLIGLSPLTHLDADALNGYWSSYNSLRLFKGALWACVLAWLLMRLERDPHAALLQRFMPGMWLGLLGVCLIGLRERWQFADLFDFSQTYRIVATFSSMHTGGGYIEAYLVAAIPFLWLGLGGWRKLATVPLFMLAVYITLSTVSRAGVLALAVVMVILALGTWRQSVHGKSSGANPWAPVLLVLAGIGMLTAGASSGYLQQRLTQVSQDWDTRMAHWNSAVSIMDAGSGWMGMGLGRFPAAYLYHNPDNKPLATYSFATDAENGFLRLGHGETLYMAQKVDALPGQTYRLILDVRGAGGKLDVPLCEKQLLNSRTCAWQNITFASDGKWHHVDLSFASGAVGQGNWWSRRPVELVLHNSGSALVEVDNVRLLDSAGADLLRNGDFSHGGDFWFFKTHSHLPWHIKNLWVETYFNQGAMGLIALLTLLTLFLRRSLPALWRGNPLATVLTASVSGLLIVGMFDSLMDAPRIAMLFLGLVLLGAQRSVLTRRRQ
jgi:hypothetical protein